MHRDWNVRVFVDVADTPENRHFFVDYKERLKERFQQIDIWKLFRLPQFVQKRVNCFVQQRVADVLIANDALGIEHINCRI